MPSLPLPARSSTVVALVTTAAPHDPAKGDQGPGAAYNAAAKFYQVYSGDSAAEHDLRIAHIAYDRGHSPATDANAWFPLPALRRAAAAGTGAPTGMSPAPAPVP